MKYSFTISHVAGKELVIPDTLSRAPIPEQTSADRQLETDAEMYVQQVIDSLPASERRLEELRNLQKEDSVCKQVREYCLNGWPARCQVEGEFKKFCSLASELSVENDILLRGQRIVIPKAVQMDTHP